MRKKVLVTASTFPRWENDTEPRFILDLCQALTDYYDITVLVPYAIGSKSNEIIGKVKVIRYHYFPFHRFETLCYPGAIIPRIREKKIRMLLVPFLICALWWNLYKVRKNYDLIHAHWFIPQGIIQSLFNGPFIVTGHGGDVTSLNGPFIQKWKALSVKKAAYITVVSSYLRDEILHWVESPNVEIIPMGCQLSLFSPYNRQENFFGVDGQRVILFVGRLAEKKGVAYLIEAMKQINAVLIIVGSGPLETPLKKQASEQGNKILFWGPQTHNKLKKIYASADILVVPSITAKNGDKEGFGLVILEGMASGVPVVAFDSGGIRQIINHEKNGLLCKEKDVQELADNINKILHDTQLRDYLRKNALQTASQYDYSEIGRKYAEIYAKILEKI